MACWRSSPGERGLTTINRQVNYSPYSQPTENCMKPPPKGWPRVSSSAYYSDAGKAIDWLCSAFGFEIRHKIEGDGGRIEHSELTFGEGLVMVASTGGPDLSKGHRRAPGEVGGAHTQNMMVYVDDVDAHC